MTDEKLAHAAAFTAEQRDGPTLYSSLLTKATDEPAEQLRETLREELLSNANRITDLLINELTRAYTAGVADGWRQAQMEQERAND